LNQTSYPGTAIESALGYRFRDRTRLKSALTPPSAGLGEDNQRLEFLGDSVLHLGMSLLVYREHPQWAEGELSKLRGLLVCTDALHVWAKELGLVLERGPRSPRKAGAGQVRNALADAVEAVLAAVFLDAREQGEDPLATVLEILERRFLKEIRQAYEGMWKTKDGKTALQEKAAILSLTPPVYELLEQSGPDHAPLFTVRVTLGGSEARATASTLKGAQAEAARALLRMMP
jgi:ribonuclease-3